MSKGSNDPNAVIACFVAEDGCVCEDVVIKILEVDDVSLLCKPSAKSDSFLSGIDFGC